MAATLLELYDALRSSLGEKQAANIALFIDLHAKNAKEQQVQIFASKIDLTEVKLELKNDINDLRKELANLKTDLTKSIGDTKTDVIRWMFALFTMMILTLISLYFKK